MEFTLKYGASAALQINLPPGALVANCTSPSALDDSIAASPAQSLENLLDFPPLHQAVVPGDHVVLALGPAVPQAADLVAAIVPELLRGGVSADGITVLRGSVGMEVDLVDPRSKLPSELREVVQLATHDSEHRDELCYLAADAQGEPIYMNRQMCEADLLIPIGCVWPGDFVVRNGAAGIWNDTLFPTFGDQKALDHFAFNGAPLTPGQLAHRQRHVDQVAWQMGVQVTAQVVPGAGDSILRILAGSPQRVFNEGSKLCRSAWQNEIPRRASLVIAGIGGGPSQQTWQNVGRALEAALGLVNDGGAIALCTELASPPGPALKILARSPDGESAQARLRKQRSPDAPLARILSEATERVTICLLSQLNEDVVTSLGCAYAASPREIARLATQHTSCILLADAQYAQPTVAAETQ